MRKLQIAALLVLGACVSFASTVDDENALKVEEQIRINEKILNQALKVFRTETEITEKSVPAAYRELEKQIDGVLPETARRIQDGRKSIYGLRAAACQIDSDNGGAPYPLSQLYDGRRLTKKELREHDTHVLEKKKLYEASLKGLSASQIELKEKAWDIEFKQYQTARGQIVGRLQVYQNSIDERIKALGDPAKILDQKADALEGRLPKLLDQFESTEHGLNAYRTKIQAIYRHRDATGAIKTDVHR